MASDPLTQVFAALADPTRRAILARLTQGAANVQTLTGQFALSQPAISKHLKVLETAGLISRERHKQQRLCRAETEKLNAAVDWASDLHRMLEARYAKLDSVLEDMKATPEGGPLQ